MEPRLSGRLQIGRASDNDVQLREPRVALYHAELSAQADGFQVLDLGTQTGTWLGAARLMRAILPWGSDIQVGDSVLRVEPAQSVELPAVQLPAAPGLVASSQRVRVVLASLMRLAPGRVPILLIGPSGTGKATLARLAHDWSQPELGARHGATAEPDAAELTAAERAAAELTQAEADAAELTAAERAAAELTQAEADAAELTAAERAAAERVWVEVSCRGSAREVAARLFGYRVGAFRGAVADASGALSRAAGGTLLLRAVDELPPEVQSLLAGALSSSVFCPLGSNQPSPLEARLVCAASHDLRPLVNAGYFREDLYFRIGAARLELPELRERLEDLEPLVHQFEVDAGLAAPRLGPGWVARIQGRRFQGNLRELRELVADALRTTPD